MKDTDKLIKNKPQTEKIYPTDKIIVYRTYKEPATLSNKKQTI